MTSCNLKITSLEEAVVQYKRCRALQTKTGECRVSILSPCIDSKIATSVGEAQSSQTPQVGLIQLTTSKQEFAK